jgi:hypothetical protein
MEKDLRTANGPIRHLEFLTNFKKSFCAKKAVDDQKRSAKNIEEVEQRIEETSNKSIRKLAQETNLSFGTVHLILKKDLQFFPYRVFIVHEIKPLENKSPHNITSLNIDRWIDL